MPRVVPSLRAVVASRLARHGAGLPVHAVVAAVRAVGPVVERQSRLAPVPAAQPRIHAWPGTAWLRARVAPHLPALADER